MWCKRAILAAVMAMSTLWVATTSAWASGSQELLSRDQTWVVLLGAVTPLLMYVVNHYAPWVSEKAKAVAQVAAAALVGALWQLHTQGSLDFGSAATLQYALTAVVSALVAHGMLYAPGGINTALKAGSNRQTD